ncbi:hypothetical protein EIP91_001750 [Steccherinum ochraceum]|uniref:Uncharacterized protein n=1 Tax=Steccherinum ochraceum TaxID=92696 RepID=A0A4R0RQK4_9APHY|nr:hypothetical protein EIP91_001750 [Steccherinum ochraceum]
MFAQFSASFCAVVALGAIVASADPPQLSARQVGDLQCNIDRVKTVGSVIQALVTTRNLTQQLSSDSVNSAHVADITGGLNKAEDGIAVIVAAIFAGQKAPNEARTEVGDGLSTAFDAASNITSTDPDVVANVNQLKTELQEASFAGDNVVDECH